MKITDVRVRKVAKEGKMKAVVSITIDDEFVVHDIKVILLDTCEAKLVAYCHKNQMDHLVQGMEYYYAPNDFNRRFYYSDSSDTDTQLLPIL